MAKLFPLKRHVFDADAYEVTRLLPDRDVSGSIFLILRKTGWRAYIGEEVSSYSLAFGRGGHCAHTVLRAVRCSETGKPLPSQASAEGMVALLEKEIREDCLLPL